MTFRACSLHGGIQSRAASRSPLILSRAVDDPELSDEILEATATELGRR